MQNYEQPLEGNYDWHLAHHVVHRVLLELLLDLDVFDLQRPLINHLYFFNIKH